MKKQVKKAIVFMLTLAMVLSTFTFGASASANLEVEGNNLQLAQAYGNFDFTSNEVTTVIVELRKESIIAAKHMGKKTSKGELALERGKVVKEVSKTVKNSLVNREYDYLFSGFSLRLPSNEIPKLLSIQGVKAVYRDVEYTVESSDTSVIADEAVSPNMLSSAPFIGANQAWTSGYTGKGMTVAVIDTGVDYNHPDLKHAFGDKKGWDFVDNDNDPMETLPGDTRGAATDHGSHVSGTVAANGLIKGVAPEAKLLVYRVLGPGGSGSSENVIAGIEQAVKDGADVMNLSLGNALNMPDYATSIALDWAMAEGVVAVTSNGNSGPKNWTVGSPGSSRRAVSVGATQLPYNIYGAALFTTEGVTYPSASVMGFPSDETVVRLNDNTYEFVHVGFGSPAEFDGKDLKGKIALISRGNAIAFVDKATAAKNAGAVGAIIYNNVSGTIVDVAGMAVPSIRLTLEDGNKMLAELAKGNNMVKINTNLLKGVGETMADFSSRGPVIDTWMIKPDVSAPGVNIVSTIRSGQYGAKQGTSMASPHVAGAAALILQANPSWGVDEVKAALMNTAEGLVNPATGKQYPHNTQGAGSIRVVNAINAKTLVVPGSHSFGVFKKVEEKQTRGQSFTIKNLSNQRKAYSFEVEFAGNPKEIKVMTSNNILVNPRKTQQVNFNVQVDASKLAPGYYEGTIKISNGEEVIKVPTILFVEEPDYPLVAFFALGANGAGGYDMTAYLPAGAKSLDIVLYEYKNGVVGSALDYMAGGVDLPKGLSDFTWANPNKRPLGQYVAAVFVEANGIETYYLYLVELK